MYDFLQVYPQELSEYALFNILRERELFIPTDRADPTSDIDIRWCYRARVLIHHPDRRGETARLQLIDAASAILLPSKD